MHQHTNMSMHTGVRETLEGRLQAAEAAAAQTTSEKDELVALLHEGRTLLEQEQAAHKEAQQQLQAERAGAVETREQVAALQEEAGRQQSDIDALARRNTVLRIRADVCAWCPG